jgi:hypothetical protein
MLRVYPVECGLPVARAQSTLCLDDVGDANLAEDLIVLCDSLSSTPRKDRSAGERVLVSERMAGHQVTFHRIASGSQQ